MSSILQLLLLSTFLVSCLSAPKFHLIETVDEVEEGGVDEGEVEEGEEDEAGSSQEGEGEGEGEDEGDNVGGNQEDEDFNASMCTFLQCGR